VGDGFPVSGGKQTCLKQSGMTDFDPGCVHLRHKLD
jgi:hypothetical protein